MKYKNEFRVKVKPTEMDLLKQTIIHFNAQNYYQLKIKNTEIQKGMLHVNIGFKSILYLLNSEVYFVMFDFAKAFRDTEIDSY